MNYCFDISAAPYGTGVSRYTTNLSQALSRAITSPNTFSIFGSSFRQIGNLKAIASRIDASPKHIYPIPPRLLPSIFYNLNLPINSFIGNADLFHSWDWYLPRGIDTTVVTTVHDLALFRFPNLAHPEIKNHHQRVMSRIKQFNTHVIAVSESTKYDLIDLFDIDPAHIEVIYEALPEECRINPTPDEIKAVAHKYSISKPYLLMVGTQEPRKNYPRQIQAWQKLKKDYDLVIVGKPAWETITPEPGLIQIGYVEGQELASFYRGAETLLYCSLAEGFGLPLLEAFYHRLPIVTSNVSSLKEIAQDAAVTVDPEDVDAISAGIQSAINSKDDLIVQGESRLQDFSWEAAAHKTLAFYQKALS